MKKTLITLLIFSLCSLLTAQFVVWHNGEIIFQTDINNVDSITLYQLDSPGEEDNPPIDKNDFSLYFNGQEIKNKEFLLRHNLAIDIDDDPNYINNINYILSNNHLINTMKENTRKFAKPNSAHDIYTLIKKIMNGS